MADSRKNKLTDLLIFKHNGSTGKTDFWDVIDKESGKVIGHIKWYGTFRQYSFFPNANTVYEKQRMRDISEFMADEMRLRNEIKDVYKKSIE